MGRTPSTSIHALRRIKERTVLSRKEITDILRRQKCVTLLVERYTYVEHTLLFSPRDNDWFIILQDTTVRRIITIKPLYMYRRAIPEDVLMRAKRLAIPEVYVVALIKRKSGSNQTSHLIRLGYVDPCEQITDLHAWCLSEQGQYLLREFVSSHISSKNVCVSLYVRIGADREGNPVVEIAPPALH